MTAGGALTWSALFGMLACVITAQWTGVTGNPVPVAAGVFLAALLAFPVGLQAVSSLDLTPGEWHRLFTRKHVLGRMLAGPWALVALYTPWSLYAVVSNAAWALVPLLLVSYAAAALAPVATRRARRQWHEAASRPALSGPKIIGLRDPGQVPPGWAALVVHRPERGVRDLLVDYRVHVDGDRVGTVGPGEALVVGLAPGPHRVQGRHTHLSSPPLSVVAQAHTPTWLVLEPGGPGGTPYAGRGPRPDEHIRLTRADAPAPG